MEKVNEFARNVILCVLIINVIDNMVVTQSYKKYIKLFTGILAIIVIFNSISNFSLGAVNLDTDNIRREYYEYNSNNEKNIKNIYKNVIRDNERYIKEFLEKNVENICVKNVRISVNQEGNKNEIREIEIKVKVGSGINKFKDKDKMDLGDKIKKRICVILCKEYSIEENKIEIKII